MISRGLYDNNNEINDNFQMKRASRAKEVGQEKLVGMKHAQEAKYILQQVGFTVQVTKQMSPRKLIV